MNETSDNLQKKISKKERKKKMTGCCRHLSMRRMLVGRYGSILICVHLDEISIYYACTFRNYASSSLEMEVFCALFDAIGSY